MIRERSPFFENRIHDDAVLFEIQHEELKRMDGILGRYSTYIYAILRIVSGFLLLWHGSQKLLGYPPAQMPPGSPPPELSPLMAVAGTIELVGGTLIMIGLFTGIAAF